MFLITRTAALSLVCWIWLAYTAKAQTVSVGHLGSETPQGGTSAQRSDQDLESFKVLTHPAFTALIKSIDKIRIIPKDSSDGPELRELLDKQGASRYLKDHLFDSSGGLPLTRYLSAECHGVRHTQQCSLVIAENYTHPDTSTAAIENKTIFQFELTDQAIKNNIVWLDLPGPDPVPLAEGMDSSTTSEPDESF